MKISSYMYIPHISKITLYFLFIFTILFIFPLLSIDNAKADVVLNGSQHIGDHYIDSYTPPDPVTNNQIENYPSYFYLTDNLTVTEVRVSNLQGLDGDRLRVYIDGNFVGEGVDGSNAVDITNQFLEREKAHTIAIRARCFNNGGQPKSCTSASAVQDNDIAFSEITLISGGQTFSNNFLQRVHLGDWTDDDWYDPTDTHPYYPDAPQGESITFSFSLNEKAYGLDLDLYRLRALDTVADIEIDSDVEGGLDPDSGESYNLSDDPYSLSISKTLEPGNHSITISSGSLGGHIDDFSWDELIITPKRLLTYYAMEEANWDGTQGEVADSTGNNHNATAYGGAETRIDDPAIQVNGNGTCRYGTFDGNGDYLEDSDAANYLNGLSAFTLMAWVKNTDEIGNDRGVFGTASPNVHDNRLGLRYDEDGASTGHNNLIKASINTNACDDSNDCLQVETDSNLQVQDTWQHIAMTWRSGEKIRIYIDGNEVNATVTSSGIGVHEGTLDGIDFLRVGQGVKDGNPSPYWQGAIDEFRIYDQALDASQIQSAKNKTHPCDISPLDHFAIYHDGHAVNCQREQITIEAHYADHSIMTDYTGAITLSTNSSHGDWSTHDAQGSLTNDGSGQATYDFSDSDNGTVNLGLRDTYVETVDIHVSDGSITEKSGSATAAEDLPLQFERSGFEFTNSTASSQGTVGIQISGKSSNRIPKSQNLQLMAVNSTNGTDCEAALNGTVDVQMAFECIDPVNCTSREVSINGTSGWEKIPGNDKNNINNFGTVSLNFGDQNDATAPFDLKYPDAGKIKLHSKYELLTANGTSTGNFMRGPSKAFVVRPFGLDVNLPGTNSSATDANGSRFKTAGSNFTVKATAKCWDASDDANTDGIPDNYGDQDPTNNADLSDNQNTPNFGQESDPASVELSSYLWKPDNASAHDPGLTGSTTISSFTDGSGNSTGVQFDEVGIIEINATISDNDYLGIGSSETSKIMGGSGPVGRFYPHHFNATLRYPPKFRDSCNNFTYIEQPFYYSTVSSPKITLTAKSSQNSITENYSGNFWKFDNPNGYLGNRKYNATDTADAYFNATLHENATVSGHMNYDGNATFALPYYDYNNTTDGDEFRYHKNGTEEPFNATVDLTVDQGDLTDDDNVCYQVNGSCSDYMIEDITGTELRYGRAIANNAYGSELLPLKNIALRTEYYDGSSFATNTNDTCTEYNATDIVWNNATYGGEGNLTTGDLASSGKGTLVEGEGSYSVHNASDPNTGPGETGYVDYRFPVPAWLRYDWNDNGTRSNPPARATFGIYKGNEHIIYQQETTWK